MRSHRRITFMMGVALLITSCKATSQVGVTQSELGTAKDIAAFRTQVPSSNTYEQFDKHSSQLASMVSLQGPVTSREHINNALAYKLTILRENRERITETMGYRILVYSGNNVQEANKIAGRIKEIFEKHAEVTFSPPNYTVKVGTYLSRLKAHEEYSELKAEFTHAVIVSERIRIPR